MTDRKRVNFKEVALEAILHGMDAVRELHRTTECGVARNTLNQAAKDLRERGTRAPDHTEQMETLAGELEALAVELHGEKGTVGRSPLALGVTKEYKVQKVKEDDPFLRLPVDLLGVDKGRMLKVTPVVRDGEVVIEVRL